MLAAVVALIVASWSGGALADEQPEAEAEAKAAKPTGTQWYGWQTLMVDAVSAGVMIAAVAESREPLEGAASLLLPTRLLSEPPESTAAIDASLALYTLGPAFVHALHGRGVPAVLSPTFRAVAPSLGTFTGGVIGLAGSVFVSAAGDGRGSDDGALSVLAVGIAAGYVVGFAAPMVIDATVLAREPIEAEKKPAEKKDDAARVKWSPRVSWSKGGPTVGLSGTF